MSKGDSEVQPNSIHILTDGRFHYNTKLLTFNSSYLGASTPASIPFCATVSKLALRPLQLPFCPLSPLLPLLPDAAPRG